MTSTKPAALISHLYDWLVRQLYPEMVVRRDLEEMLAVFEEKLSHTKGYKQYITVLSAEYGSVIKNAPGEHIDLFLQRHPTFEKVRRRLPLLIDHYGLTPTKIDRSLDLYLRLLARFNCPASIPVTATILRRYHQQFAKYQGCNMEFMVHGYTHNDYLRLDPTERVTQLHKARQIFAERGLPATGFRAPYLRGSADLYPQIEGAGFCFLSDQPILWDVIEEEDLPEKSRLRYQQALEFNRPWLASSRPSLPWLWGENRLVEIPVSLPDDEILCDRINGPNTKDLVKRVWLNMLAETYRRGELFTLQLHPERIALCHIGLEAVLDRARRASPSIWVAGLSEIATWWRARAEATVEVSQLDEDMLSISVTGPPGVMLLVRGLMVFERTQAWGDEYVRVQGTQCRVRSYTRPFIGLSPRCPAALVSFLKQQGYIVEVNDDYQAYPFYLDLDHFSREDELPLLHEIEDRAPFLVRLGRWPDGARSCLSITGDIDAYTLWDYGIRIFE